jgi:DNA primase large subunit
MINLTRSTSTTSDIHTVWRVNERITQQKGKLTSQDVGDLANRPHGCSCQQILLTNPPGPSDCHGCPYRHFSSENLQTALISAYSSQGMTHADLPEITSIVKAEHYHVACTRVFEITHSKHVKKGDGIGGGESVTHPNQYVAKSRDLEKEGVVAI